MKELFRCTCRHHEPQAALVALLYRMCSLEPCDARSTSFTFLVVESATPPGTATAVERTCVSLTGGTSRPRVALRHSGDANTRAAPTKRDARRSGGRGWMFRVKSSADVQVFLEPESLRTTRTNFFAQLPPAAVAGVDVDGNKETGATVASG